MRFADLLGQEGMVRLLQARLREGTALDTNYVFSGAHGSGKTTSARILAKAILCERLDKGHPAPEPCNECDNCKAITAGASMAYVEQDAASNGTIDHIRSIVDDLPFAIMGAEKRIYCFDEMHRMTPGAQDVLLKPMEEKKLLAIMCTTEAEKIRGPIRSRCEEYTIRKATREELLTRMKWVLDQEGVAHEDEAVLLVVDHAGGHVRDILNRLEMLGQLGSITNASVREYLNLSAVALHYEVLLSLTDPRAAVALLDKALARMSADEITAGMAEAALATFRLANNLVTDLVYMDRALAQKVYALYGNHVLRIAEHFARMRVSSKSALVTEVLALCQAGGRVPEAHGGLVLMASSATNVQPLPPPATTSPATLDAKTPSIPAPVSPPTEAILTPAKLPSNRVPGYPSEAGPLGKDPLALTDHDHQVVPAEVARNSKTRKEQSFAWEDKQRSGHAILTPAEWALLFRKFWLREESSV